MRSLALVISSFCVTILGWGFYLPMLQWGQKAMNPGGPPSRWRSFFCLGISYFLVGVIVPTVLLKMRGENGQWSARGIASSLLGGTLGAIGALGAILAVNFGANPLYMAPIVFGCAPVVNTFLTTYMAGKTREIGPFFLAGLIMVALGAITVLANAPHPQTPAAAASTTATADAARTADAKAAAPATAARGKGSSFVLQVLSIAMIAICWGAYGPTLHKGQAAMGNSRLRPFICVGMAYFLIAVCIPPLILASSGEPGKFTFDGTFWSLLAGGAGAIGALGIIMAFTFGGKPVYVMPLIFGGAPIVATFVSIVSQGLSLNAFFLAGLIIGIAGAALVLIFAPKGHPPHSAHGPAKDAAPAAEPPKIPGVEPTTHEGGAV
jgi:hypothetical protein